LVISGILFSNTYNMDNYMDNIRTISEYDHSTNGFVQHRIRFNFLHYLLTVYKEDYKKHKMNTWWLGHIFGISGLIFTLLNSIVNSNTFFDGIPTEFKGAIGLFTALYVLWQSLRAFERWRIDIRLRKKIDLENKELDLNIQRKEIELSEFKKQVYHKK